jgi:hypothetical protein
MVTSSCYKTAYSSNIIVRFPRMQMTLQSQGQVLRKMRFMPSSLTSKSHRLLTAKVDAKHKKVFKVKAVITETDPEKEKHEKEKVSLKSFWADSGQLYTERFCEVRVMFFKLVFVILGCLLL